MLTRRPGAAGAGQALPGPTRAAARRAIVDNIGWYNGTRLHSALRYRSRAVYLEL